MKPKLKAYGRVDLDGTHRAVIETDSIEYKSLADPAPGKPRFLKIQNGSKICGCILSEVKSSGENRICLDKFKMKHLQIRDGDEVSIDEIEPVSAVKVELSASTDISERDIARFIGKPVVKGEKTALYTFSGEPRLIVVTDAKPAEIVIIGADTDIKTAGMVDEKVPLSYNDIGGLSREIKQLKEIVEYPLRFPQIFEKLGVSQPRGVILYGPPGTGKTLIVRTLANEVGAKFYTLSGPEVFSMWYGESEKKLRLLFEEAQKNAPSIILIDELDAIASKREKSYGEMEKRIVTSLLTLMDGLVQLKGVVVVATTNRINSIDPALRREGRFGHEINIGVPDSKGRKEILAIHTHKIPLSADVDLDIIAEKTVGFVGADIKYLCREAAYNALRRSFPEDAFEKGNIIPDTDLEVSQLDFENALPNVSPSAIKEFLIEIPKVSWEDIGGLSEVKRLLIENIVYGITKREVFKKVGVKPAKGLLLYGPPGTGKTLLAKAVASQCGANFITVKGPEIRSKWVGESEEKIRFLFAKAREASPCVIFFDEIDAAVPSRGHDTSGVTDTIVNQILSEMDGIESAEGVFVMGATNRVELLDPAVLRPGRFDYHIEVPLPDPEARESILNICLKGKPLSKDIDLKTLTQDTKGFSGAEISEICREAIWDAIRDADYDPDKVKVTMEHLKKSVDKVSQTRDDLKPKQVGFSTANTKKQN